MSDTPAPAPAPESPPPTGPARGDEGRRLRADARRNRERVIVAATEAFAAEGSAVSMAEIARRAGVGVGTIYRQFPTKESLYAAIARHGLEQLVAEARALADAPDPGAALFGFLRHLLDSMASKRDLVETLERAGGDFGDFKASLGGVQAEWEAALGVLVERAQRSGALRPDVSGEDVIALVGGTCGAVMHSGLDETARGRLATVLCDGLCPHEAAEPIAAASGSSRAARRSS